jgi:dUTP pyrophosphatase
MPTSTRLPTLSFQRLRAEEDSDIPLPRYMTPQAAGMDLHAAVGRPITIACGRIALIPTGFAMALPPGFEGQIRPRSGLAVKYGVGLINSPGTIDSDYRGEIKIPLINFGDAPYTVRRGDRIAQMVIQKVYRAQLQVVESLDTTSRDTGGFGHTGVR